YIAVPVTDDDGAVTGVLAGKVNLEELKTILAETPGLGARSETYLAAPNGLLFTPALQPRAATHPSEGIQKGLDHIAGTGLYANYAGEPVVGAYRPLGRLGVVLLAEQAQSEAFVSLLRTATLLLFLSAIIVIGAMALGYVLTNRIVLPLRLLTDMAEAISQGNLEQTVPLQREDEIGRLANAFNRMTFQLRDLINTLEERVQNRTQALQISAEVARKITAILDLDTLLFEVSNRIRDAFGYYYVQILLADEQGYLTTRAGSGEAGKKLTAQPYRVKLGARNPVGQAGLGQLQVANHLAEATGWQPHPLLPHTRSELAIPLRRGTGTIGVLDIQCGNEDAFSEEDITTLQSIADQLVIAVRNARLFRESEAARRQAERLLSELEETSRSLAQRSVQLQTAMQVSKATATILDTPLLLQETVNLIKEHFNFYYVGLFLTDETGEWAILKAGTGEAGRKQLAAGHRLKIEDASMIGWSIRHKQPRITGDVSQDEVHYVNPFLPDTRSEMALPLLSRETALGAISIQSTAQNAFTQEDIHVLQTVADQIAIALQNSRLFQQIQAIQARFEDLYHRAPTGYHTLAPDGTIREINDTELHMLGYDGHRHEIVGRRKLTDFLTGECQAYFESALQTLRDGKGVENAELTFVRRDGSLLPVMMNATPVRDATGEVHEIYASVQDISRLKEAETAREALLREADTLYRLGQQLLTAENEEEIYQASLQAIQTANPSRGIAILRYRQTADNINLELVALWNNPAQEWPPVPLGSTFSARELGLQDILLTGITVTATANTYADAFNANLIQLLDYLQIQSLVGTPLWSRGKVIGFVLVGHHTPTPFTPAEVRLFEGVARQMSVGIDNLTHLQEALHRATQLEAAAEVAKNTTAEVDLTLLLPRVVDLLQNSFGYYHISIFLVDEYRQHAVLQAATGDAGQQLLAENYRLPIDARSLVGASILEARARVIFNVTEDPHYLPHPLLPDTRAELTLPLIARGEVLGALDIQSVQSEDFQSGEVMALQTIADQVANAIHVARLFEQERAARQEVQDLHRRYLEREWSDFLQAEESLRQPFFTADGAPLPPAVARQWLPRLTPRIQQDAPPAPR
ncbi:MAG: GAF domain-containing protein, partial [Caldilineae bacterium]